MHNVELTSDNAYERIDEMTPSGGDYSEIFYLDDNHNIVNPEKATKCVIRELKNSGELVNEIWGVC